MLLRQLFEEEGKTAVLAFGRLNPPTIGHAKLVGQIKSHDGDHYLFLSQTQKPKTDPLDFATKLKFARKFFPDVNVGHPSVRTPIQALEMLENLGYTDVIFVAGSDRVEGFQKLFDTYNGQPDKSGNVPFKFNSIRVASAGERDPDADGAEGMSASKMRKAAAEGNLEAFAQGTPDKKLAQSMYDAVRKGMGVKDAEPVDEWVGVALKGSKYAWNIAKFFWNNKWAIGVLTVTWKTLDWIGDAIAFVKKYLDNPIVQGMIRYGLPAIAVAVALYGGKKLYNELIKAENEKDLENVLRNFKPEKQDIDEIEAELNDAVKDTSKESVSEILGFATRTPKRATIKKKRPPEEDSVQDKLKKRREMAAKGNPNAYKTGGVSESDLVLDRSSLIDYIREKIVDYINQERDIDKLAQLLKQVAGKDVKVRGKKFTVTSEDLAEACKHGMYYCSTDRKMKCRQGPKKSRG